MIQLIKINEPEILSIHKKNWTKDYIDRKNSYDKVTNHYKYRYREYSEIKEALLQETHKKCAYCESKMLAVDDGEVDHIFPIAYFPELIYEWNNFTLSCHCCNYAKLDYYDKDKPLIHPYQDNPSQHILFIGYILYAIDKDIKGKTTIDKIKLNRPDLIEARLERLKNLDNLIRLYELYSGQEKEYIKKQLLIESNEDKQYSLMVKAYLKQKLSFSIL